MNVLFVYSQLAAYLSDIVRIKKKTKLGIPNHTQSLYETDSLDVNKIASSDDLVDILESNYHNEQMRFRFRGYDEGELINMDQYVKSIASIAYVEYYEPFIRCAVSGFFCGSNDAVCTIFTIFQFSNFNSCVLKR